jgi:cell division protein FtsZ
MGGGTGTGAAPVIAQAAKEQGILTVAVVTKPFHFEARRRMSIAEKGIEELAAHCDSLITIPNAKLADVLGGETLLLNAFKAANDVLQGAVQGIAELITRPGLINVDFADVRTVMSEMGMAMMGAGQSSGDDRAIMAAQAAIGSPLLEDINLSGACGILVNITAGTNLTMKEFEEVGSTVSDLASEDATVVMGTVIDPDMGDDLRVTVVATGLGEPRCSTAFREQPIRLVANGPTGRNDRSGLDELAVEEINRDRDQRIANVENKDLFERQKDIDYLDIPSFLRTQAD